MLRTTTKSTSDRSPACSDGKGAKPLYRLWFNATVTFWVMAGITLVGCRDIPPRGQSAQVSSRNENPALGISDHDVPASSTYVTARATLAAFEKDSPWFDDSGLGHDDGTAPLASFVFTEPASYTDRALDVLFKHTKGSASSSPPSQADIGDEFTFQVPEDFLTGEYKTIDNSSVRSFRKVKP